MIKKYLLLVLLAIIIVGVASAQNETYDPRNFDHPLKNAVALKEGRTATGNTYANMVNGDVSFYGRGMIISSSTKINGNKFTPVVSSVQNNTLVWTTGENNGGNPDPDVKITYEYNATTLKETIVLKKNKDLSFPISVNPGYKIESWNGGYRITTQSYVLVNQREYIEITKPFGYDATGKYIPMEYSYDGSALTLVYNKTGITYPLTIDPTYYLSGYNTQLQLLMHMNGTAGGHIFYEEKTGTLAGTFGSAATNTSQKAFGTASGYFPTTTSYISLTNSTSYNFSSPSTILFWYYTPNAGVEQTIMEKYQNSNNYAWIYVSTAGRVVFLEKRAGTTYLSQTSSGAISSNVWQQVVIWANSTNTEIFVNGSPKIGGITDDMAAGAFDVPSNLTIGNFPSIAPVSAVGHIDELAFWRGINIPMSELYPQPREVGTGADPVASFTSSANPSVTGNTVLFNDTSTNSPDTWNWSFNNRTTWYNGTTRNQSYAFPLPGVYNVTLVCNNTYGISTPYDLTQLVANLTSDTSQDIVMAPQFALTVHVTDSATGLPIADTVTVTDTTHSTSNTTIAGTTTLFADYSIITGTLVASGYDSKSFQVVLDSNMEVTYQLTKSIATSTNVWYTQHLVKLTAVNSYGAPIDGARIEVNFLASSLPNTSVSWIQSAFGVSADVASEMQNGSMTQATNAGSDGAASFMMFPAFRYGITVSNSTTGLNHYTVIHPADSEYIIYCPTSNVMGGNTTQLQIANTSMFITEPNMSYVTFNFRYQDMSTLTTAVTFNVTLKDNNTVMYSQVFTSPGASVLLANYTVPNIRGQEWRFYYNATRSAHV